MKNHCAAKLMLSTLEVPERRIGQCGDATRAPTQQPEWQEAAQAASTTSHSGLKAINPRGLGAEPPIQTECCEATSLNLLCILLKLAGRQIAQRRVEPLLVIDPLDEFADACPGVGQVTIFGSVDLLVFKRFHKALGFGIVVGIAPPAHADGHTVLLQQINVSAAGILYAAIGMMHQTWHRFPLING